MCEYDLVIGRVIFGVGKVNLCVSPWPTRRCNKVVLDRDGESQERDDGKNQGHKVYGFHQSRGVFFTVYHNRNIYVDVFALERTNIQKPDAQQLSHLLL